MFDCPDSSHFFLHLFQVVLASPTPMRNTARKIIKSLEGKPVLTINSTSIVRQALVLGARDTEMKGRTLVMGEAKINTEGENYKDREGTRLCRAPGVGVGPALLLP